MRTASRSAGAGRRWAGAWGLGCLLLLGAGVASAQPARVDVVAEVVHASDSGSAVEPASLAHMKEAFARSGITYKSFRRLSREKLTLQQGQPAHIKLPNGHEASLNLLSLQDGSAKVQAGVPPVETTYTLGREGSVFIQAGPHNGGMLILVLSPAQK